MRQRIDQSGADQRQQAGDIDARRLDQGVDQQALRVENCRTVKLPCLVRREPPHQRIAVRMDARRGEADQHMRSEEHTSELQSLMRISYAVFCLKKNKIKTKTTSTEK